MKLKFVCTLAGVAVLASAVVAQTGNSSSTALPAAPGAATDPPAIQGGTGTKIAALNIEQAIFGSNEGQRDMDELSKKFEPKSNELKAQNDEIEALKKKLTAQGTTLTNEQKADLQRQIEQKQKSLDRAAQDAREDFQAQQNEIGQRILQKLAPVIMKYANEHDLGMILDTSQPWPQGLVLWAGPAMDITKPVVDAYNAQSGIAPPPPRAGSTGGAKPAGSLGKPVAPATSKPAGTPGGTTPPK
ncbi:MAG TPA: OmpH family outer membrane protein [Terriglobales bacterium]|nr:OmpH family outer membrane protein [Terriglobales bacterium]